ncbi:hypothetical protein EH30_07345 [Erythrobacter sp. JL475]|nr:hypothetical protein EH30_07345 [Erythrobacter sp. JL475]
MALFARASEPPSTSEGTEAYVLWIAREWHGIPNASLDDSIDDLGIVGEDAIEFIERIGDRLDERVWDWPWSRFVELRECLSLLFPFMLIWQLLTWPFRGRFSYPSNKERLTLRHIAFVLERGEWIDP